jgi:hypothetical protein
VHSSSFHSRATCPAYLILLDMNSNYTCRRVQAMELLIMLPSPTCPSISLLSRYSEHPVLKHPQSVCWFHCYTVIIPDGQIYRHLFQRVFR